MDKLIQTLHNEKYNRNGIRLFLLGTFSADEETKLEKFYNKSILVSFRKIENYIYASDSTCHPIAVSQALEEVLGHQKFIILMHTQMSM